MAKLTLSPIADVRNTSAATTITANNAAIVAAVEKTLSRDGTSPNQMETSLDMNSNRVINLPEPETSTEPVRKIDFDTFTTTLLTTGAVTLIGPPGAVVTNEDGVISAIVGEEDQVLTAGPEGEQPEFKDINDIIDPNLAGWAVKTPPTGTVVGTTDTQTLTNKTLTSPTLDSPAITVSDNSFTIKDEADATKRFGFQASGISTGTFRTFTVPNYDATLATQAGTETLTNKTLTAPVISTITNTGTITLPTSTDTLVGRATTDTLTNKTLTAPVLGGTVTGTYTLGGTPTFPTGVTLNTGAQTLTNKTLTAPVVNGTVTGTYTLGGTPTFPATVVDTTTAQTLTNKTLTSPVISTISNTGTVTLPTATDTLVGRATTDTLTNKTLTSPTISGPTFSGTLAGTYTIGGTPTFPSSVATLTGAQTLTNKTLTTPVISSISNTGTLTLPTSTDTLVGRATTDTLTNKTINASSNTVSNLTTSMFASNVVDTDGTLTANSDTRIASQKAVKTYTSTAPTINAPTLTNSWVNFGAPGRNAGYAKTHEGMVKLMGTIKSGTTGTVAFTLPAGFRPGADLYFNCFNPSDNNPGMVGVSSTGDVTPYGTTMNTGCSIDAITFLAEA